MPGHKRRRGGQPHNQNARKHGFYSTNLTPEETAELWRILNREGSDPALSYIRMKYSFVVRYAPDNRRLLREVSRLLNKWLTAQSNCTRQEKSVFRGLVRKINNTILNGNCNLPELTDYDSQNSKFFTGTNEADYEISSQNCRDES